MSFMKKERYFERNRSALSKDYSLDAELECPFTWHTDWTINNTYVLLLECKMWLSNQFVHRQSTILNGKTDFAMYSKENSVF